MEKENINTPVMENDSVSTEPGQPAEPSVTVSETPVAKPTNPPNPLYQGGETPEQPPAPAPIQTQPMTPVPSSAPETVLPEAQSQPMNLPNPPLEGGQYRVFDLLKKAKEKIQFRKRAKLEKIVQLAQSKNKITNNDIQKLLRCSDATATRYLTELVKQGKLRRVGPAKQPFYEFLDPETSSG